MKRSESQVALSRKKMLRAYEGTVSRFVLVVEKPRPRRVSVRYCCRSAEPRDRTHRRRARRQAEEKADQVKRPDVVVGERVPETAEGKALAIVHVALRGLIAEDFVHDRLFLGLAEVFSRSEALSPDVDAQPLDRKTF